MAKSERGEKILVVEAPKLRKKNMSLKLPKETYVTIFEEIEKKNEEETTIT